jgi:hypothetical protein
MRIKLFLVCLLLLIPLFAPDAAATAIKAHVASHAGSTGNTIYLYGFLY